MAGRKVAVLGGAGGIGRVLVARLQAEGDTVCVLDLPMSLERHQPEGAAAIAVDLKSEESVIAAAAELKALWGTADCFVNLAGYNSRLVTVSDMETEYFDDILDGNLRGAFLAAKYFLPLLDGPAPAMVTVSTGLSAFVRPKYAAYAAAKAGVTALTKTLALEWAPKVRVNGVGPALVDTAFLRGGTGRSDESNTSTVNLDAYANAIPLKRLAAPEDIVGPIMFLLGPDSSYMTGQILWINGGGYMP